MERVFRAAVVLGIALLVACGADRSDPGSADPPAMDDIASLIPAGAEVLAESRGDINDDGVPDLVLALEHVPAEGGASGPVRSLLLMVGSPDGGLRCAARNDRIIPCATCGGALGEPSIHLIAGDGAFTLVIEGGTGSLWSNEYAFRHEGDNRWTLESIIETTHSRTGSENTRRARTSDEFGQVEFSAFDPRAFEEPGLDQE